MDSKSDSVSKSGTVVFTCSGYVVVNGHANATSLCGLQLWHRLHGGTWFHMRHLLASLQDQLPRRPSQIWAKRKKPTTRILAAGNHLFMQEVDSTNQRCSVAGLLAFICATAWSRQGVGKASGHRAHALWKCIAGNHPVATEEGPVLVVGMASYFSGRAGGRAGGQSV